MTPGQLVPSLMSRVVPTLLPPKLVGSLRHPLKATSWVEIHGFNSHSSDDLCGEPQLHLGPASSLSLDAREAERSEAGAGVDKSIFQLELCHSIAA